jgi:trans-2,3-dihydro-3-hydroxyanthranilate isomerase
LSESDMQLVARETYLTETMFVVRRNEAVERERGVLVRIFTPRGELPFAGHPTLGTAMALHAAQTSTRRPQTEEIALELRVGRIPVTIHASVEGAMFAEMHEKDPQCGETHSIDTMRPMLGLRNEDFVTDQPIQTVSTGLPFVIVPLKPLSAIQRAQVDWAKATPFLERIAKPAFLYLVTRETQDRAAGLHARAPDPSGDDPGTGSAAGCTAAWMLRYGTVQPDERIVIEQGSEIQRPSRLYARAGRRGSKVTKVRGGGYAVEVMRGEYRL